jgi:flagellar hook-length control protein FliK
VTEAQAQATTEAKAVTTDGAAESAAAKAAADDAKPATTDGKPVMDLATRAAGHEAAATGESAKSTRSHGNEGSQHGAGAGFEVEKKTAAFSSGGAQQHGLDLGSSDRHPSAAVEVPAHVAVSTTAPGAPGEAIHVTRPEPEVGGAAAPVTTTSAPTATTREAPPTRVEPPLHHPGTIEARWGERVTDAVRLSALRGGGEIRLQLEPEGLGHIDVRLHLQSDGVRAVIVAEHESTRALLTSQQHVLQDAFNRSELRLSGFSVDVGSGGGAATTFAQADERGQGGGTPSAPSAPGATTTNGADGVEAAAPLANGRVSVRV